jgi:hypothetical protein
MLPAYFLDRRGAIGSTGNWLLWSFVGGGANGLRRHEYTGQVHPEWQTRLHCGDLAPAMGLKRDYAVNMGEPCRGTRPKYFLNRVSIFDLFHLVSFFQD